MQENKLPEGNIKSTEKSPLEVTTTYRVNGRSFVVEPVFKKEQTTTIGDILLRLMQADSENKS